MFSKILIANRGEIACRIAGTARALGIGTVAVFTPEDRGQLHVCSADQGVGIDTYLDGPQIIDRALAAGVQAIHPGYGFLSENADFAEAVNAAGLVFIGPPAAAIRAMGSKVAARRLMEKAGVAVVPGYHGRAQDMKTLAREAQRIGYPVMIKASAGGGGRGMRLVTGADGFKDAALSARREAKAAFADDTLLLEKAIVRPRHVEVQVFADRFGNVVSLSERDCSIQRRHQKVIEEAPAPSLSPSLRRALGEAGRNAVHALDHIGGYLGAGTIEFLLDAGGAFYFMEMNTRLQVEHPVTEMIFGEDLVEWQLTVAAGGELPRDQEELEPSGHAMEARLYAEDPGHDFRPGGGTIERFRTGAIDEYGGSVRIDSAVREGDTVSDRFDPMIAKVVTWGIDREAAAKRMSGVLGEIEIAGPPTNLGFLRRVFADPAFVAAKIDTGFIARHSKRLIAGPAAVSPDALILASLAVMLERDAQARATAARSNDPHSPWHATSGWRLNGDNHHVLGFRIGADADPRKVVVSVHYRAGGLLLELPDGTVVAAVAGFDEDGSLIADLDGEGGARRLKGMALHRGRTLLIDFGGDPVTMGLDDPAADAMRAEGSGGGLVAPMPGLVAAVHVKAGDRVAKGDPLMVLEAMKMEHAITAPEDGVVEAVHFHVGDRCDDGAELISFVDTPLKGV